MSKERYNEIIDEVYNNYLKTHKNEIFIMLDEMDLSKEEFIKKAINNYGFGFMFGITLNEQELSVNERNEWFQINLNGGNQNMKYNWKDYELDQQNIPKKFITLEYNNEKIKIYE